MPFTDPDMQHDARGRAVPALAPYHGDTVTATISTDTAVSLGIPSGCVYYEVAALFGCYIDANGTADTASAVFPAGAAVYRVLPGQVTVSMKRIDSADTGPVTLTPMG